MQETFISILCNLRNTKVEQVAHTEIQRYNFFASISFVLGVKGNRDEKFKNVLIILQKTSPAQDSLISKISFNKGLETIVNHSW